MLRSKQLKGDSPMWTWETGDPRPAAAADLRASPDRLIEEALEATRELLGMDIAYLADTRSSHQDYVAVAGDGESFGARVGEPLPLEGTYCAELLAGRHDGIIRDARRDDRVCELPITERGDIGAYIGMPLVLSDGSVFGTFCCLSHDARPELGERDAQFIRLVARLVAAQLERQHLLEALHREQITTQAVRTLLAALAVRDGYTEEHSHAVVDLACQVGRALGLSSEQLADLEHVALLHDVGKLGIPDQILRKHGPLSDDEWEIMRTHSIVGASVVAEMDALAHLAPAIRAEHERWDGNGYPDGLAGEAIPLPSRIVFVSDAIHAMTSDRPYRSAMSPEAATAEVRRNAGSQFCPMVVDAALAVLAAGGRAAA
jgi:hypothetical protein